MTVFDPKSPAKPKTYAVEIYAPVPLPNGKEVSSAPSTVLRQHAQLLAEANPRAPAGPNTRTAGTDGTIYMVGPVSRPANRLRLGEKGQLPQSRSAFASVEPQSNQRMPAQRGRDFKLFGVVEPPNPAVPGSGVTAVSQALQVLKEPGDSVTTHAPNLDLYRQVRIPPSVEFRPVPDLPPANAAAASSGNVNWVKLRLPERRVPTGNERALVVVPKPRQSVEDSTEVLRGPLTPPTTRTHAPGSRQRPVHIAPLQRPIGSINQVAALELTPVRPKSTQLQVPPRPPEPPKPGFPVSSPEQMQMPPPKPHLQVRMVIKPVAAFQQLRGPDKSRNLSVSDRSVPLNILPGRSPIDRSLSELSRLTQRTIAEVIKFFQTDR